MNSCACIILYNNERWWGKRRARRVIHFCTRYTVHKSLVYFTPAPYHATTKQSCHVIASQPIVCSVLNQYPILYIIFTVQIIKLISFLCFLACSSWVCSMLIRRVWSLEVCSWFFSPSPSDLGVQPNVNNTTFNEPFVFLIVQEYSCSLVKRSG